MLSTGYPQVIHRLSTGYPQVIHRGAFPPSPTPGRVRNFDEKNEGFLYRYVSLESKIFWPHAALESSARNV
jgi:hypothetical protein